MIQEIITPCNISEHYADIVFLIFRCREIELRHCLNLDSSDFRIDRITLIQIPQSKPYLFQVSTSRRRESSTASECDRKGDSEAREYSVCRNNLRRVALKSAT